MASQERTDPPRSRSRGSNLSIRSPSARARTRTRKTGGAGVQAKAKHLSAADLRLQAALADGTIHLLSCEWLRTRPDDFVMSRHQELPSSALLSPQASAQAFGASDRRVGVLSYGWLTRAHPDPGGERARLVTAYLRSSGGLVLEALFWDFGCLPEPDENGYISEAESAQQKRAFSHMNELYASAHGTSVIRVTLMPPPRASLSYNLRPIDERGWCIFEMYVSMIVVGIDAQDSRRCEIPKLVDATGGAVPELKEAPTPDEFAARLDLASFTVEADRVKAQRWYLDYYLENGVGARARLALAQHQRQAQQRRMRIRWRVCGVALPAAVLGFATDTFHLDAGFIGNVLIINSMATIGLALHPDEGRAIRCISMIGVAISLAVVSLFMVWVCVNVSKLSPHVAHLNGTLGADTREFSDDELYRSIWVYSMRATILLCASAYMLPPLLSREMAPRAMLLRLYTTARVGLVAGLTLSFFLSFGMLCYGDLDGFSSLRPDGSRVSGWVIGVNSMVVAVYGVTLMALYTPTNRSRAQEWFSQLGSTERATRRERESAAIASLIGDGSQQVDDATSTFRLLPLHGLDERDLPGSGTGPADAATLRARTQAAELGALNSVFASHSWHDSRRSKWAALREWAARYETEHGAPPLLWLDAACVPQDSSTDRSLALLPLYIAGCQRMVVLAGPTFVERLWCVMEIFCFLRMGGAIDRITVVPVLEVAIEGANDARETSHAVMEQFATFDVNRARCAKDEDTQRLLACIEAGFGAHEPFNQLVRQTFADRVDRAALDNPPPQLRNSRRSDTRDWLFPSFGTRASKRRPAVAAPLSAAATSGTDTRVVEHCLSSRRSRHETEAVATPVESSASAGSEQFDRWRCSAMSPKHALGHVRV